MSLRLRWIAYLAAGFLALQAADFVMTWLLIGGGVRPDVYESNPLARSILERGGWAGMALFKLSITAVALAAVLGIALRRREAAVRLLATMCLVMLGVNAYSGTLLASADQAGRADRRVFEHGQNLGALFSLKQEFMARRDGLCDEVLDGRLSDRQAVARLTEVIRHYAPLLKSPPAGRLPDVSSPEEVEMYFDYHLRSRASDRGLAGEAFSLASLADLPPDPLTPLWLRSR